MYGQESQTDKMALEGSLDLFVLLVEYVAGGVFLAIVLWAIVLLITGIMGRLSMMTIIIILITYISTAMIGYFGALLSVPIFLVALLYMVTGIINKLSEIK